MFNKKFEQLANTVSNKLNSLDNASRNVSTIEYIGKVKSTIGSIVIVHLPRVKIGDLCKIVDNSIGLNLYAEVVAIFGDDVKLLPLGSTENLSNSATVYKLSENFMIKVGDFMLGKIVDGLGNISGKMVDDESFHKALKQDIYLYSIMQRAPDPLTRNLISEKLETGVKSLDMFVTCAKGQRLAIFAGPGMGKTTLLSMIIKNAKCDVIVVALIGERGREIREFIDLDLDDTMRRKTVIVAVTSDRPPVEQLKAAYIAQTVAEYFRDQGKDVIMFVDSITRFARAGREVGLSAGEIATRGGFPPSVFLSFPRLMERAGNSNVGSITAFYTVLMEGEQTNADPIADEVRSIVDGHIILSKKLVEMGHFPAISVLASLSRVADRVISDEQCRAARKLRMLLSKHEELEFLIRVGEYKQGNDKVADEAIQKYSNIMTLLKQKITDKCDYNQTLRELQNLAGDY